MEKPAGRIKPISEATMITATVAFLILFENTTFFLKLMGVYGEGLKNQLFIGSVGLVAAALTWILTAVSSPKGFVKPMLALWLFVGAAARYVDSRYGLVIDADMIQNAVETNPGEAADLVNFGLFLFFFLWWCLPVAALAAVPLKKQPFRTELAVRIKGVLFAVGLILVCMLPFGRTYASFFREHKPLRYHVNPVFPVYAAFDHLRHQFHSQAAAPLVVGEDAAIPEEDTDRELIILVVGETARADHFSLNGYSRQTNPLLAAEDVISFTQMTSCGTSTAVSVPCMFSYYTKEEGGDDHPLRAENALDVLKKAGVNILWRDNNSSAKGVADRVSFQDYRQPEVNPECDIECRDIGMLDGLDQHIQSIPEGDILIVLHQMGSHGPAYHKRYPESFEYFTPACHGAELGDCSAEEITNAYDNTLRYTDYFLAQTIAFLKRYDDRFETLMFYVSDHGESLGESGIYLHGMPYALAPTAQTHVASLMWLGAHFQDEADQIRVLAHQPWTHDAVFHTLLAFFEVDSNIYQPELSLMPNEARMDDPGIQPPPVVPAPEPTRNEPID